MTQLYDDRTIKRRAIAFVIGCFLGFSVLLFIAHSVNASGYIDSNGEFITSQVPENAYFVVFFDENIAPSNNAWTGVIDQGYNLWGAGVDDVATFWTGLPNGLDYTYWYEFANAADVETYCGVPLGAPGDRDTCAANAVTISHFDTYTINPPNSGNIFGDNGILGTSTSALMASVITGVQDTGANLWPLFAFVGVPLAVVIGLLVVQFITMSVGKNRRMRAQVQGNGADFDFEKADSLKEFYSRDGGIDKEEKKSILALNDKKENI